MNKPYIKMSTPVYNALFQLKEFNYKNIYNKSATKKQFAYYQKGMHRLFNNYLETRDRNNIIYTLFLNKQHENYLKNTKKERQVIDFIAGMTDDLFLKEIQRLTTTKNG